MTRHPFKLAISNITTDSDPKVNREHICQAAKDASARGARLVRHEPNGDSELVIGVLDEEDPALDTALNKARPWRRKARDGSIYKVDCPIR